jgi:hypothetical protein
MDQPSQQDQDVSQAPVNQEEIPNFLRLDTIPVNYAQSVETDKLFPVNYNEASSTNTGFIKYELQNKGFLHAHSKFVFSLVPDTTNTKAFQPLNVGIASVIKKCVLKIGNQVVNEQSAFGEFHSLKSSLTTNEHMKEREQYMTGRMLNTGFLYTAGSDRLATSYGFDNGKEYDSGNLKVHTFANMNGSTVATRAESPSFSIDMSDLFPFLKVHTLPLYMMDQAVSIEFTLYPTNTHRVCIASGQNANTAYLLDQNECFFMADYLFFGAGDEMNRYAEQNRDMSFTFTDYRTITSTIDATAEVNTIRNLGMANRAVSKVATVFNSSARKEATLLNKFSSIAPTRSASGIVGTIEYNLRLNDRFEFSSNVKNTARLFSLLTQSEGVPHVSRAHYSGEGEGITTDTFEGRDQQAQTHGHFFFLGTEITEPRVGSRGIELTLIVSDFPNHVDEMRSFVEYLRVGRLRDGQFTLLNA